MSRYTPITPKRVMDTRPNRLDVGSITVVNTGRPGASTAHVNVTIVDSRDAGFVTAWDHAAMPNASVINTYAPGQTVANAFNIKLAGDGSFLLFTSSGENLIVDVMGYFE